MFARVIIGVIFGKGVGLKGSELKKLLKNAGCFFVEDGKEHEKWHSRITNKDFRVPRHDSKEVRIGTANKILKDAGLK